MFSDSPSRADTNLDRAADVCRQHVAPLGVKWSEDSKYDADSSYSGPCKKVYSLYNKRDIDKNLEVIKRGIDDPSKQLPEQLPLGTLQGNTCFVDNQIVPCSFPH